ncbi:hypothetical protein LJR290_007412 [Variovorax sp. LjRoot290]|uniref:hypothetical protein n=1 Tax=unclassified Variovorax TaxID=663243 RepID=UPI003ECC79AD
MPAQIERCQDLARRCQALAGVSPARLFERSFHVVVDPGQGGQAFTAAEHPSSELGGAGAAVIGLSGAETHAALHADSPGIASIHRIRVLHGTFSSGHGSVLHHQVVHD